MPATIAIATGAAPNYYSYLVMPLPSAVAVYTASGLAYYRHQDHLGSSRLATTPSRTKYSSTAYTPFGETYAQTGTADASFTGQDQDTASGTYDFMYRKYSPVQGRWLSPDPAGMGAVDPASPQSWNRYAYVMNNPMSLVDPLGLECVWDDGSYDASDDPQTGSAGGCGGAGGTWVPPDLFENGILTNGQTANINPGDWSSKPSSVLAQSWTGASDTVTSDLDLITLLAFDGGSGGAIQAANNGTKSQIEKECIDQFNDSSGGKVVNFMSMASPVLGPDRLGSTIEDVGGTTLKYGVYKFFSTASQAMARTPFGSLSGVVAETIHTVAQEVVLPVAVGATAMQIIAHAGCDSLARQETGQATYVSPAHYP